MWIPKLIEKVASDLAEKTLVKVNIVFPKLFRDIRRQR
jgi:hypothetical protein